MFLFLLDDLLSVKVPAKPDSLPKDPAFVPLPMSDLSGASLGDSVYSISPSLRSQSTSGDEEAEESDYLSGDDLMEDQNDNSQIFIMDSDDTDVSYSILDSLQKPQWPGWPSGLITQPMIKGS